MAEQATLVEPNGNWEPGPGLAAAPSAGAPAARLKPIDRKQSYWGPICVEDLIPADHVARAIWELTGKLDLRGFLEDNKSVEGKQGRNRWNPQLMVSVWVYGYSLSIGSAREIERQMEHEPGLRWLSGDEKVNHHSLSDFRVVYGEAVQKVFVELLGLLAQEGMVKLDEVTVDGTKVRAVASGRSMRREKTLREHLEEAEAMVNKLNEEEEGGQVKRKKEAAQKRAAQERQQRLEQALKELEQIRKTAARQKKPEQVRASESEPEARVMKDGHGGYGPSYNVQAVVETSNGIVVGVGITQQVNDSAQLEVVIDRMKEQLGQMPERVIADSGYINDNSIEAMEARKVELIGPDSDTTAAAADDRRAKQSLALAGIAVQFSQQHFVLIDNGKALQCPAGKQLNKVQKRKKYTVYQASRSDCQGCAHQTQCCPKSGARIVKMQNRQTAGRLHRERMKSDEAKQIYRKRGQVAEFPFAWIKEKLGLRKFHVKGMIKAGTEALWVMLTHNIQQWVRLRARAVEAVAV